MLKVLWHWTVEIIKGVFTFNKSRIVYGFTNIYWLLRYGVTYYDLQDFDAYITHQILWGLKMQEKIKQELYGARDIDPKTESSYKRLLDLSEYLYTSEFEEEDAIAQEALRMEYINLLSQFYFRMWL